VKSQVNGDEVSSVNSLSAYTHEGAKTNYERNFTHLNRSARTCDHSKRASVPTVALKGKDAQRTRLIVLHHYVRSKLLRMTQRIDDAATRTVTCIVLHADRSVPKAQIARALGCCRTDRGPRHRSLQRTGEAGLLDRREDNGQRRADKLYVSTLKWILESSRGVCSSSSDLDASASDRDGRDVHGVRISKRTWARACRSEGSSRQASRWRVSLAGAATKPC